MIPRPPETQNMRYTTRRRGAIGRRAVKVPNKRNRALVTWWKAGRYKMAISFVLCVWGTFNANAALTNVLQFKFPYTMTSDKCYEAGWTFVRNEEETGAARYAGGMLLHLPKDGGAGMSVDLQFIAEMEGASGEWSTGQMHDLPSSHMDFDSWSGGTRDHDG